VDARGEEAVLDHARDAEVLHRREITGVRSPA
jgi:hypothetical protein